MHTFWILILVAIMAAILVVSFSEPIEAQDGKSRPSKKDKLTGLIGAFVVVFICILATSDGHSNVDAQVQSAPHPTSVPATPVVATAPREAQQVPQPIPTPALDRTHFYSLVEDGEYGYESALSDEEKNRGVAVKPIQMIRYLGERDGVYSIQVSDGAARQIFSCKEPCDFIKMKAYFQGELVRTEMMKNADGSLISAVMEDAIAGELEPYKRTKARE